MSWLRNKHYKMLELNQLDTLHALIADAAKDTILWLQAHPSAEERVHVLAIQERLAALDGIIMRRKELRGEVRDDWVWSETVREVLSLLDKAGEVRSHIVGLGRLAERLTRELPGSESRLVYNDDDEGYVAEQQNKQPGPAPEESKSTNAAAGNTQEALLARSPKQKKHEEGTVGRGKFCDQVIDEIKRIKNLVVVTGRSVAEIEKEHPGFVVWKVRTSLSAEDQEAFSHPNQWGAPVGYAKMVLSKIHSVRRMPRV
jgi:hypothetical protein